MFPERLDGAELVELDQLRQTAVRPTVSSHPELAPRVLGDDKMAAPVAAPFKGNDSQKEKKKKKKAPAEATGRPHL